MKACQKQIYSPLDILLYVENIDVQNYTCNTTLLHVTDDILHAIQNVQF